MKRGRDPETVAAVNGAIVLKADVRTAPCRKGDEKTGSPETQPTI